MTQDVENIIAMIDRKINALNQAKQTLRSEFGNGNANMTVSSVPVSSTTKNKTKGKVTQKDKVITAIRQYGPLGRKEIHEKTGVPTGTISAVVNDRTMFVSKDEKWHLIEKEEKEESPLETTEN
ncbi:MAG: hypothetical protein WC853_13895 [Thermodesulfovibrionales bacterium]